MAVVDVHTHVISPGLRRALRSHRARHGVELASTERGSGAPLAGGGRARPLPAHLSRVDARLAAMNRQDVDVQVRSTGIDLAGYGLAEQRRRPSPGTAGTRRLGRV